MMTQLEMRYYNAVINMSKEMSVTREKKVYDLYKIYIEKGQSPKDALLSANQAVDYFKINYEH